MTCSPGKMFETLKQGFRKLENIHDEKPQADEILPFVLNDLTPAMMEEARTELKETEEVKRKALASLRKLIEGEKKLVTPIDDPFLLAFLRSRKYNLKGAFKLLQNFWSFRKEYKGIYDKADPEAAKELVRKSFVGFLRFRDRNGSVVILFKIAEWDPNVTSYDLLFQSVSGFLIYAVEFAATQVTGFRVIIDLRGLSWVQLKYVTPSNVILLIRSTQFCFPARYKGIHLLSDSKMFHFVTAVVYPLLTSKLKKRIKIHGENNLESLKEYIHPSVLPEEFGGEAERFSNSKWEDIMEKNMEKVLGMLNYGYKD